MNDSIELSIIIINYHSAAFTRECLQSIFAGPHNALEVIVVDNASYDECADVVRAQFPEVIFLQSERNLGFAGANNYGLSLARGRRVLFLNPDTEIQGAALQILLAALDTLPDAGMVGARLLNSDRSLQTSSITAFPSILNQVLGTEYLRRSFPRWRLWGIHPLFENHPEPVPVDAISGACMMARREVIDAVHGFSTDYFMYAEDVDLCLKVRKAGWKVYYVPQAEIVHHGGKSSGKRVQSNYAEIMIRESLYQFMGLHRGWWYALLFRAATALACVVRLALLMPLLPASVLPSLRSSVSRMWSKWSAILGWCCGTQSWVRRETTSPTTFAGSMKRSES